MGCLIFSGDTMFLNSYFNDSFVVVVLTANNLILKYYCLVIHHYPLPLLLF